MVLCFPRFAYACDSSRWFNSGNMCEVVLFVLDWGYSFDDGYEINRKVDETDGMVYDDNEFYQTEFRNQSLDFFC